MIRFWAGDIARWDDTPCPCGRTYPRLPNGIYGRTDDMIVIRGENVYPSAIEDCIRSLDELGDEFRILVRRQKEMDELIVQAEYEPGTDTARIPEIKERLAQTMKAKGLRTGIELKEPNTFQRTEFKAKRVIDERNLGE
jgi:phenylacetate-CoA ligase